MDRPSLTEPRKRLRDYLIMRQVAGEEASGRPIHKAECTICHTVFKNERSGYKHLRKIHFIDVAGCWKLDQFLVVNGEKMTSIENGKNDEETDGEQDGADAKDIHDVVLKSCLTQSDRKFIHAIINARVALDALKGKAWQEFAETFKLSIPSREKPRGMILTYADEIAARSMQEMRGSYVTLITDGGTVIGKQFYPLLMFCQRKLYFIDAVQIERSTHVHIAESISRWLQRAKDDGVFTTSIITDNARNLLLATRDSKQLGPGATTQSQSTSVQKLTGDHMVHISCAVHTVNLALKDYGSACEDFKHFIDGIGSLFAWMRQKDARQKLKSYNVNKKVPLIMETKWLCYYQAFGFLEAYREQVEMVMNELQGPKELPLRKVPEQWIEYLGILKSMGEFILEIEGNGVYLSEFYLAYRKLHVKFMEMHDERASRISHLIEKRMQTTGDIVLAQLAYFFTREGFREYSALLRPLGKYQLARQITQPQPLWEVYRQLSDKMVQLSANYGVPNAFADIGPMFYTFLMNYEWTNEPFVIQMQRLANTTITLSHREVSWRAFTEVAVKCRYSQRLKAPQRE